MVISIQTNAKQVGEFMANLPRRIEKSTQQAIMATAKDGVEIARSLAPFKSGALKTGIISRMLNRRQGKILSTVTKTFPYNLWVNQSPPFEFLPQSEIIAPFFKTGQKPFRYGDSSAKSAGGKSIRWTGTPRFFTRTFEMLDAIFVGNLSRDIARDLRG